MRVQYAHPLKTVFKKSRRGNGRENTASHMCNRKDIKPDPSRISDPAIMGLLLQGAIALFLFLMLRL